jgi:hypothetical protein
MFHVPEKYRIRQGALRSDESYGNNGLFIITTLKKNKLFIIASDGEGWEHVSVHVEYNGMSLTPTWSNMCFVKDLFWDVEDVVIQYHPKKSEYVNQHPNTLHLWRPIGIELPTPPTDMIGPK